MNYYGCYYGGLGYGFGCGCGCEGFRCLGNGYRGYGCGCCCPSYYGGYDSLASTKQLSQQLNICT